MSFSYKGQPTLNKIDEVRLLVQDNKVETHLVENEEIQYALDKYLDNINAACALICEMMAASHARKQEIGVSNYKSNQDSVYQKLISQADRFRVKAINSSHFRMPSLSVSGKEVYTEDTDIVQPSFHRGLLDNPQINDDPMDKDSLT
jgi:hypothetical protein